jgi:hypothetical protein
MIVLILAEPIASLEGSMIFSALPTINREFGDLEAVSWLVSGGRIFRRGDAVCRGSMRDRGSPGGVATAWSECSPNTNWSGPLIGRQN